MRPEAAKSAPEPRMRLLVAGLLFTLFAAVPARALDVTGCPAVVPPGEVGVVQNDIDCAVGPPEHPHFVIVRQRNARRDLNGHTITLLQGPSTLGPLNCVSRCEVNGPGTLTISGGGG